MSISVKSIFSIAVVFLMVKSLKSQELDSIFKRTDPDTAQTQLNMDAVYNRPSLQVGDSPVNIGGYFEANSIYSTEDGVSDGLSFEGRRLTLIVSAPITKRIKFLSEIEFEDGGEEIDLEFAAVDVSFSPQLNLRGGIVMNPIGAYNQNHDGPKWEFVERPNEAVDLLPVTFSNPGVGLYGKFRQNDWIFGYEAYVTNGFNDNIINNKNSRTSLPAINNAVADEDEEGGGNFSGKPLFTGKIDITHSDIGELGLSYMGGVYNNKTDGDGNLVKSQDRRVDVVAVDFNTTIEATQTKIIGEASHIWIDVPDSYGKQYGDRQWGTFVDVVQPVYQNNILGWQDATVNVAARFNHVDFNVGDFEQTGESIGDEITAITPAISFRPSPQTVFRVNYRYQWQKDIINNPRVKTATWYVGLSTYF